MHRSKFSQHLYAVLLQGVLLGLSNTAGVLAGVFGTAATGYILQKGTTKVNDFLSVKKKKKVNDFLWLFKFEYYGLIVESFHRFLERCIQSGRGVVHHRHISVELVFHWRENSGLGYINKLEEFVICILNETGIMKNKRIWRSWIESNAILLVSPTPWDPSKT